MDFTDIGIKVKNTSHGVHATICPKCSHTRKHKTNPCLPHNNEEGKRWFAQADSAIVVHRTKPNLVKKLLYWLGILKDPRYNGNRISWIKLDESGQHN